MSMPSATLTSMTTGHACWPSTMICQACSTVIVQGLPAACVTHAAIPHTCNAVPYPTHGLIIASASGTVIIENIPAARVGDAMSCGDLIASGATTVITGD